MSEDFDRTNLDPAVPDDGHDPTESSSQEEPSGSESEGNEAFQPTSVPDLEINDSPTAATDSPIMGESVATLEIIQSKDGWKFDLPPLQGLENWVIEVPSPPPITSQDLLWRLRDKLAKSCSRRLRGDEEFIEEGDEIECVLIPTLNGQILTGSLITSLDYAVYETPSLPGLLAAFQGSTPNQVYEFELTLPYDYPVESMAGQTITLIAKIGQVWELDLPDFDDPQALENVGLSADLDEAMSQLAEELDREQGGELLASSSRCALDRLAEMLPLEVPQEAVAQEVEVAFERKILPLLQVVPMGAEEVEVARQCYLNDVDAQLEALLRIRSTLALQAVLQTYNLEVDEEILTSLEDDTADNLQIGIDDFCQVLEQEPLLDQQLERLATQLTALQFVCSKVQFVFPDEDDETESKSSSNRQPPNPYAHKVLQAEFARNRLDLQEPEELEEPKTGPLDDELGETEDPEIHPLDDELGEAEDPEIHALDDELGEAEDPEIHPLDDELGEAEDPEIHALDDELGEAEDPDIHPPDDKSGKT